MIRLGVLADLPVASAAYSAASLSNAGDRANLLAHPEYLALGPAVLAEGRIAQVLGARGVERLEVTANPHALGFYRAAGFTDCGVAPQPTSAPRRSRRASGLCG